MNINEYESAVAEVQNMFAVKLTHKYNSITRHILIIPIRDTKNYHVISRRNVTASRLAQADLYGWHNMDITGLPAICVPEEKVLNLSEYDLYMQFIKGQRIVV